MDLHIESIITLQLLNRFDVLFCFSMKGENSVDKMWKTVVTVTGSLSSYLFGGWTLGIQILFTFVALDYVTGVISSGKEGKLSSRVGIKGISKKVMIFIFVAVGHLIDIYLENGNNLIRDGVIAFFVFNEIVSITENAGRIVPIPPAIQRAIEILKDKKKEEDK